MRTTRRPAALAAALLLALPAAALADGGAPSPSTSSIPMPELTPEQRADQHYNRGIKLREKAWELEEKAAAASAGERAKLEGKIEKTYRKAAREYESAVELDRNHYRAHSDLGYALRKLGDYDAALAAYGQALEMVPNYAEAIEYRAEAYLGLGRLEDAKEAYLQLFAGDRERADMLMEAMQQWVEHHRQDPGGHDPATVESFAEWVSQRAGLADQTASLSELRERRW
jgi:tetratricopeptide (TPR) repeat protein